METSARLGEIPFAVVDLETTGLWATRDRVVEVAIVSVDPAGVVVEEFESLVNPLRDVGPTEVHGLTASDAMQAPIFRDLAWDIGRRLHGAVVVGHNVRFDLGFLAAEFARLEVELPELPQLCTARLAHMLLGGGSRRLGDCCDLLDVAHCDAHTAIGDARATAGLLRALLEIAHCRGIRRLDEVGCSRPLVPPSWLRSGPATGKQYTRAAAARTYKESQSYLVQLVRKRPSGQVRTADDAEYLALLDRALDDRTITPAEARALMSVADKLGLTSTDVLRVHDTYMQGLVAVAWADGVVTEKESQDLFLVGEMLGVPLERIAALIDQGRGKAERPLRRTDLKGQSVCFTGSLESFSVQGECLTRELASRIAEEAGLVVLPRVTRKLDLLVVADANSSSGKAVKAREYGTRIMAASRFFSDLGVSLE